MNLFLLDWDILSDDINVIVLTHCYYSFIDYAHFLLFDTTVKLILISVTSSLKAIYLTYFNY